MKFEALKKLILVLLVPLLASAQLAAQLLRLTSALTPNVPNAKPAYTPAECVASSTPVRGSSAGNQL